MGLREEITLVEDPVWTKRFDRVRNQVEEAAEEEPLGIHHVGSTAIPDVPGKPALDVLVVFPSYDPINATARQLVGEGYDLEMDEPEANLAIRWADDHAVFVKMHTLADEEKIRSQLLFRDYLRDHPEGRREYEQVKREAVEEHPEDHRAYTEAKADIVRSLLDRAKAEGYAERLPEYL